MTGRFPGSRSTSKLREDGNLDETLSALTGQYQPGKSLPQPFYCDAGVFREDRKHVLDPLWHLAGHAARIPHAGDYFLFGICAEEIIVVRDGNGAIRAHYNVCRHRGSRICTEASGNAKAFVCPYHAWTYRLNGTLRGARLMPGDFRPQDHGLHPCRVRELHGLIFVSLADEPVPFDDAVEPFRHYLEAARRRPTRRPDGVRVSARAVARMVFVGSVSLHG